jgi:hypothetical protein
LKQTSPVPDWHFEKLGMGLSWRSEDDVWRGRTMLLVAHASSVSRRSRTEARLHTLACSHQPFVQFISSCLPLSPVSLIEDLDLFEHDCSR